MLGYISDTMKVQVFISHITMERELALFLKDKIEKHFLGFVDVFVSSDHDSIEAGEPWLEALQRNLKTASLQIILCSPTSISRPWVNFEAGAGWLKGIPLVPLCHSKLEPEKLPMPLSTLEGGKTSDPETFFRLYRRIAKLVPCACPEFDMKALALDALKLETAGQADASGSPANVAPEQEQLTLEQLRSYAEGGNEQAVQQIAVTQSPESFSVLMDLAVNHIDEKIKIAAIKALATFRSPDITPLCELLVQDRWQVAEACAKALGRFKNPQAIPYLIKASDQHVDWVTTQECATALGVFAPQQPETVCPALVRALELGSFEGEAASQSLRRYGSIALPFLLESLQNPLSKDSRLALKTIVLIGDKQVLPTLEAVRARWRESESGEYRDYMLAEVDKSISQLSNAPITASLSAGTPSR